MSPTTPHILLLGGHGKISLLLTRKIIARSWNLTSVIRNAAQKDAILAAADANGPGKGKINVLVESLDDVKSVGDAQRILGETKPDWVVWSAGAGGKGGVSRTYAIDRDACTYFIRASVSTPSITKFLMVSALASRSAPAPWWGAEDVDLYNNQLQKAIPDYYKAKIVADETLAVLGEKRKGFEWISLRPGRLEGEEESGKVVMGKTRCKGRVSRGDVAEVAVKLLEKEGVKGWFDLLGGSEVTEGRSVDEEIGGVLSEGFDAIEGESLEDMGKRVEV